MQRQPPVDEERRQSRSLSDSQRNLADLALRRQFLRSRQVFLNRVANIFERFFFRGALRPAASPAGPERTRYIPRRFLSKRRNSASIGGGGGGGSRTRVRESSQQKAYVRSRLNFFGSRLRTGKSSATLARLISIYGSEQKPSTYPVK